MERAGGDCPPEIVPDDDWLDLWVWFWDLSASRPPSMGGPAPLPYSELRAWLEVTGEPASSFDIRILRQMDLAYLAALAKEHERQEKRREALDKAKAKAKSMV